MGFDNEPSPESNNNDQRKKIALMNQINEKIKSNEHAAQNSENKTHELQTAEQRINEIRQMPNDEQKVAATYAVLRENKDLMNKHKDHFTDTSVSFAFSEKGTTESGTTILEVNPNEVQSYAFGNKFETESTSDPTTEAIAKVAETSTEDYIRLVVAKKLSEAWLKNTEGVQEQQLADPLDFEELKSLAQKPYLDKLVTTASLFAGHFSKNDFVIKITPDEQTIGSIAFAVGIEHVVRQMEFVSNIYFDETKNPQWLDPEFLLTDPNSPLRLQENGYPAYHAVWFSKNEEDFASDAEVQVAEQVLGKLDDPTS